MKHRAEFVLCASLFRSEYAPAKISLCKIQNIGSGYRWCCSQLTSSNDCSHIGIVINILVKLSRTGSLVHPFRPHLSNKLFNKRFWLLQLEIGIEKWRRGDLEYRDIRYYVHGINQFVKNPQKKKRATKPISWHLKVQSFVKRPFPLTSHQKSLPSCEFKALYVCVVLCVTDSVF
jgi:hypothetical protein